MPKYRVKWAMAHVEAPNEREAAEAVRAQYFKITGATQFTVAEEDQPILEARAVSLDLILPSEDDIVVWHYNHHVLRAMAQKVIDQGGDAQEIVDMLERPWNWNEVLTEVLLDAEYSKVSMAPVETDPSFE